MCHSGATPESGPLRMGVGFGGMYQQAGCLKFQHQMPLDSSSGPPEKTADDWHGVEHVSSKVQMTVGQWMLN